MDKMGTLPFSWDSLELNDQFFHTLCNHDRLGEIRRSFGLGQRNNSVEKNGRVMMISRKKKVRRVTFSMLMFPWNGISGLGIPKSSLVLMNALLMYRFTMEKIALTKRFYNSILISQRTYFFVKCQPLSCGSSQTGLQWQCKVNSTFFQIWIAAYPFV